MGIETIVSEPAFDAFDTVEKLCEEYKINVALHNHPSPSPYWNCETVLKVCKGRSKRIGACADTGHWMRSKLNPLECIKKSKDGYPFPGPNSPAKAHDALGDREGNVRDARRSRQVQVSSRSAAAKLTFRDRQIGGVPRPWPPRVNRQELRRVWVSARGIGVLAKPCPAGFVRRSLPELTSIGRLEWTL
jgi:hypothetical protein